MSESVTEPHQSSSLDPTAAAILGSHLMMAISTIRRDGWPQTMLVGYANEGATIYFVVFRASQKFANIAREPRVSLAVGEEPQDLRLARAVYAGALASEVTDSGERRRAWELLQRRHTNLIGAPLPDPAQAVVMRAECRHLSVVDYTKGLGHTDAYDVSDAE